MRCAGFLWDCFFWGWAGLILRCTRFGCRNNILQNAAGAHLHLLLRWGDFSGRGSPFWWERESHPFTLLALLSQCLRLRLLWDCWCCRLGIKRKGKRCLLRGAARKAWV